MWRETRWRLDDALVGEGGNLGATELLGGGGGDRVGGDEGDEDEERAHREEGGQAKNERGPEKEAPLRGDYTRS